MPSKKIIKICSVVAILAAGILILHFYPQQAAKETKAQEFFRQAFCSEILPIGTTFKTTNQLLLDTIQHYQDIIDLLDAQTHATSLLLGALSQEDTICSPNNCKPQCVLAYEKGKAGEVNLDFTVGGITVKKIAGMTVPICAPESGCGGTPCPDVVGALDLIKSVDEGLETAYQETKSFLVEQDAPIPADVLKTYEPYNETIGATANQKEIARRYLELTQKKLTATFVDSCVMTEAARRRAELGSEIVKGVSKGTEMIQAGQYWPLPWSYWCRDECEEGLTLECVDCLGCKNDAQGNPYCNPEDVLKMGSLLGKANLKIYGDCPDCLDCAEDCKYGPSSDCKRCVFRQMSPEQAAQEFLLGDTDLNWVCCE